MNNPTIESHFGICHSASLSSQCPITMKKNKLFKEKNSKYKYVSITNEENKVFKVQNKVFKVQNRYQIQ